MSDSRLLLFDGHAIVHRAFHANQNRLSVPKTGEPTGAVFGFVQMLLKVWHDQKPTHWAIAFDRSTPTFRHEEFAAYKAQRPPQPDDLRAQFPRVRQLVEAFGIPIYEADGYEADDVLGTLAQQATAQGVETIIATGDADATQLVGDHVRVLTPRVGFSETVTYDEAAVVSRYGVRPDQIPDWKALKGDPSDNIPGVPGIGDKGASKLLQDYGTIEGIYEQLDAVKPPRTQEALRANEDQARQGKRLATIIRDVPGVRLDLDACRVGLSYDREQVMELFRELEFSSLVSRIPARLTPAERDGAVAPPLREGQLSLFGDEARVAEVRQAAEANYQTVTTVEQFDELLRRLSEAPQLVVDTETTNKDEMRAHLVGIALGLSPSDAYYIPVGHRTYSAESPELSLERVLERLRPALSDPRLAKVGHNLKYDLTVLANHGLEPRGLAFDTMIAAYLLNEQRLGLKELAFTKLREEMTPITELIGSGKKQVTMAEVAVDAAAAYACTDAVMTWRLRDVLEPQLSAWPGDGNGAWQGRKLFDEIEVPLIPVLSRMERAGVALNTAVLRDLSQELGERMLQVQSEIWEIVGHQFNIGSPPQLAAVLFEGRKLQLSRKTKTGFSTDVRALEALRDADLGPDDRLLIDKILEWRQITKLRSTYVDALPALIHPTTGRVHTNFNQTVASTGRLSSTDPNLQNIPVRSELGGRIRHAFVAEQKPGEPRRVLLGADYSQIELRILAHITQDPGLLDAFRKGEDIHAATAAQVMGVPIDQVTPDMRRIAKTINFGVTYGISDFGLAERTNLSRSEAGTFIKAYFEKYRGIDTYIRETRREAREQHYVQTLDGRRKIVPDLGKLPFAQRQAEERAAVNMPIQGTAADIIKKAMIQIDQALRDQSFRSRMILQVHDELVFEAPQDELPALAALVRDTMEGAMELRAPLRVDLKVGQDWGSMETYKPPAA